MWRNCVLHFYLYIIFEIAEGSENQLKKTCNINKLIVSDILSYEACLGQIG